MSQKNDFFAPIKLLWGLIDSAVGILGLLFIGLLIWDAFQSRSNLPEALWYTVRRTPSAYTREVKHDIRIQEATYLNELQKQKEKMEIELEERTAAIYAEIREELENSVTGCISIGSYQNLICIGPRQTARTP